MHLEMAMLMLVKGEKFVARSNHSSFQSTRLGELTNNYNSWTTIFPLLQSRFFDVFIKNLPLVFSMHCDNLLLRPGLDIKHAGRYGINELQIVVSISMMTGITLKGCLSVKSIPIPQ